MPEAKQEWRKWLARAADIVFPRNCQLCEAALPETLAGVLCAGCLAGAKWIRAPFCARCSLPFDGALPEPFACGYCAGLKFHFSRAVAACRAEGVVRDAIHRFKYGRELYFERHLADWLLAAARERVDWAAVDAIVPVPLFPRKEREREFNQAELLSRSLGKAVGRPVIARKLRRVKETGTQTRLDAAARRENVRDAFAARGGEVFAGKRLALVDDVFTTGATLDACARVLHEMGAQDVIAITVARGV